MAIMEMKAIIAYVYSVTISSPDLEDNFLCRVLISYFSFELAYEGQVAHPTAAITMSSCMILSLIIQAYGFIRAERWVTVES